MASLGKAEDWDDNQNLRDALNAYPELASAAAWDAAQSQLIPSTDVVVTVYDKVYKPVGEITDYISLEAVMPRNETGTATIVLKTTNPLVPIIQQCTTTTVPITITFSGNVRWSGRVNSYTCALDQQNYTTTIQCVDDYSWLSRILVWPDFLTPIEVQFPSYAVFIGPAVTCVLTMIAEQALRLQSGIWELVDNFGSLDFHWQSWFGTLLESQGNPLQMLLTPIVVLMPDVVHDTSPWISLTGRMDKISELLKQTLSDYGLSLTCNLWLPGDPQPGEEAIGIGHFLKLDVPLTQPTIVVTCVDRSGITGPTGTMFDGLVEQLVDLNASMAGETARPFLNPNNEFYPSDLGLDIAPRLGVNFVPPWVYFVADDPKGGLLNFKLNGYHPLAFTIIGGGKSPQWLNDLINATLEFLIDAIEITIGITGIPDTLLDGTFDDILLAFQQVENAQRRQNLGPYGFPEYFVHTGASAYTLDEWFALMQGMWDTRGYNSVQIEFENGFPYTVGEDIFVGALASFVYLGQMYTDYVWKVTLKDDRKSRTRIEVTIGDGRREENPILRSLRMLTGLQEYIHVISLSTGAGQ